MTSDGVGTYEPVTGRCAACGQRVSVARYLGRYFPPVQRDGIAAYLYLLCDACGAALMVGEAAIAAAVEQRCEYGPGVRV